MATTVVKLLNPEGAFHSLRLRAKAKMCANDQVICHEEYCPYARDYYAKLQSSGVVARLLDDHPTLEPDAVFARAREAEVCPFEVSLELGGRVQVVVCDYNYAFDPYVALTEFAADNDLSDTILVIDEIHNLVGRGRDYYSPALSAAAARRAAEASARGGAPIHLRIAALCRRLAAAVEGAVDDALELAPETAGEGAARAAEAPIPEERFWELRPPFDEAFIDYLEHNRETRLVPRRGPLRRPLLRFSPLPQRPDGRHRRRRRLQPHRRARRRGRHPAGGVQGPQPLPRRGDQPHPLDPRPLGHPVAGGVLPRPLRLRRRPHRRGVDPQPLPGREPPGGDRPRRSAPPTASAPPTTGRSPSASAPSPPPCPATAWPSSPATTSWPRSRRACPRSASGC